MEKTGNLITGILTPLLTLVIAFYTWTNDKKMDVIKASQAKQEMSIKSLDSIAKVQEISQKDVEFDRKLKFDIYAKAFEAIEGNNAQKQQCVVALIKSLLTENDEFRNNLLSSFIAAKETSPAIKIELQKNLTAFNDFTAQQTAQVKLTENKIATNNTIDKRWDVDIFYLESNAKVAEPKAQAIEKLLDKKKYRTRVRILPDLVNAKAGYMIAGNQIRFDTNNGKDELTQVQQIQKEIGPLNYNFQLRNVGNNTPWYISIFVI